MRDVPLVGCWCPALFECEMYATQTLQSAVFTLQVPVWNVRPCTQMHAGVSDATRVSATAARRINNNNNNDKRPSVH